MKSYKSIAVKVKIGKKRIFIYERKKLKKRMNQNLRKKKILSVYDSVYYTKNEYTENDSVYYL